MMIYRRSQGSPIRETTLDAPHPVKLDTVSNARQFVAPARVNLLGEHTDYTGGYVLPMAIPFFSTATISQRSDETHVFHSDSFSGCRQIGLDEIQQPSKDWSDYPVGVLHQLKSLGSSLPAFELHLSGNIPLGAGLSSSASVEVASALAMMALADIEMSDSDIAQLCRRAENEYVQSPCGIMDQFAITAARAGHALLLNTRTLEAQHIPMNRAGLSAVQVVICNSMVKHSIANGEYGIRRQEVESGQQVLRHTFPDLRDLGDANMAHLLACENQMSHMAFRRCRHIITENTRVCEARKVMLSGDPAHLGRLMLLAHSSQRDDFACSCDEIDFLVEFASSLPGCFGARLTGGGFGGCTVNLVDRMEIGHFSDSLRHAYLERFGFESEIYVCDPVDGAVLRNGKHLYEANQ